MGVHVHAGSRVNALLRRLHSSVLSFASVVWDYRLQKYSLPVLRGRKTVFRIFDFGRICRYRASTFESKEPETLAWIDGFKKNDSLLDIGANIGMYSLYAAKKGVKYLLSSLTA